MATIVRRFLRRGIAPLFLAAAHLWAASLAAADIGSPNEQAVKAAFVFNFAKFVEWPDGTGLNSPLVIGTLGNDAVIDQLHGMLANKTVNGRPIEMKRLSSPAEAAVCQIVYIADSSGSELREVVSALDHRPVLLVGSLPRFVKRGGTIGFAMDRDRVRFDVNQASALRAGLRISSQLLKLARHVETDRGTEVQP